MNIPADLRYTTDHEWIRLTGKIALLVLPNLPRVNLAISFLLKLKQWVIILTRATPFGTIEAVKTVSDLFMPVSGKVLK